MVSGVSEILSGRIKDSIWKIWFNLYAEEMGMKTWKPNLIGLVVCVSLFVLGFASSSCANKDASGSKSFDQNEPKFNPNKIVYNTIPEDLNKKGLFFVNKTIVKKKKIKSIKTFDFLYDKSGKTIKRNRGDFAEFDFQLKEIWS